MRKTRERMKPRAAAGKLEQGFGAHLRTLRAYRTHQADIAKKLVWGRLLNCGQSCVAPEYVLTPRHLVGALGEAMVREITARYGDDPSKSHSFGRLVSTQSAERVVALLKGHGGKILIGGKADTKQRYVAPTIVVDPRADSPIMCEESFAPVHSHCSSPQHLCSRLTPHT